MLLLIFVVTLYGNISLLINFSFQKTSHGRKYFLGMVSGIQITRYPDLVQVKSGIITFKIFVNCMRTPKSSIKFDDLAVTE